MRTIIMDLRDHLEQRYPERVTEQGPGREHTGIGS
jgi:hypothetical protein